MPELWADAIGMIADWTRGSGKYLIEQVTPADNGRVRVTLLSLSCWETFTPAYRPNVSDLDGCGLVFSEVTDAQLVKIAKFKLAELC